MIIDFQNQKVKPKDAIDVLVINSPNTFDDEVMVMLEAVVGLCVHAKGVAIDEGINYVGGILQDLSESLVKIENIEEGEE